MKHGELAGALLILLVVAPFAAAQGRPRARDLGVPFDGKPGPLNAITDVKGVEVGHTTLISGEGTLKVGTGPVRTGVTAVLPPRQGFEGSSLCRMVHLEWQWRDDWHNLGGRVRLP